jgi:hypothetical protein
MGAYDDDAVFRLEFAIPEDADRPMAAKQWLEAFADQLADNDQIGVEVTGHFINDDYGDDDPRDADSARDKADDSTGKGGSGTGDTGDGGGGGGGTGDGGGGTGDGGGGDGGGGKAVVYIMVCPGKRPLKPAPHE